MLDLVAVLIALGLLMYLAYRGVTLLILAPAMALLAALLTGCSVVRCARFSLSYS